MKPAAPPPKVSIRLATVDDMGTLQTMYSGLLAVLARYNPTVDPDNRLQADWVEKPEKLGAWLIERDGAVPAVVGFALTCGDDYAHALGSPTDFLLYEYFIEESERRNGTGRAALEQLLERHPGTWSLDVLPGNTPAMGFWKRALAAYGLEIDERVDDEGVTFVRHHFRVPRPSH